LTVSPTSLYLHARSPSDAITLENRGTAAVRVQVTGFAWSESPSGEMVLKSDPSLVFFPTILTIAPGERRAIRVGIADVVPSATERTYRVFFEELPSLDSQLGPQNTAVAFRSRIGIPVFLDPLTKPTPRIAVEGSTYAAGTYSFHLINRGNAHFLARTVALKARDAAGNVVVDKSTRGWYVLADGERPFQFPVTPAECERIHDVVVTIQGDTGDPLTRVMPGPQGCKP
jgi:fimbrial chaperone protein